MTSLFLVHRLRSNFDLPGAAGLTNSAGWPVGWFFVPVACLWKPFQAMRETWQASDNPPNWQSVTVPSLPGIWWPAWILTTISGQITLRLPVKNVDQLIASTWIEIVINGVAAFAALCCLSLLKRLTTMQRATFSRLSGTAESDADNSFGPSLDR